MFIFKLIIQIIANALGILLAVKILPNYINFTGDAVDYLIVGLILALANLIIRPILKIISAPLIFLTLGLFLVIINVIILFGVDYFVQELAIFGFLGYVLVSLILAIINAIFSGATKKKSKD